MNYDNHSGRILFVLQQLFNLDVSLTTPRIPSVLDYEISEYIIMAFRGCSRLGQAMAVRCFSEGGSVKPSGTVAPKPVDPLANVSGLTTAVVGKPPAGAHTADYKVPEYFLYERFSYHHAEIELAPYRCPQPNANRKQ